MVIRARGLVYAARLYPTLASCVFQSPWPARRTDRAHWVSALRPAAARLQRIYAPFIQPWIHASGAPTPAARRTPTPVFTTGPWSTELNRFSLVTIGAHLGGRATGLDPQPEYFGWRRAAHDCPSGVGAVDATNITVLAWWCHFSRPFKNKRLIYMS